MWKATTIIPGLLYLGNQYDSKQVQALRQFSVSIIINCAEECRNHFPDLFQYKNLVLKDRVDQDISSYFIETCAVIERARQDGQAVLVHCVAGASRSPTICIAYLLQTTSRSLLEIISSIKESRPFICPNRAFLVQLMEFEKSLRSLSESTLPKPKRWAQDVPIMQCQTFLAEKAPGAVFGSVQNCIKAACSKLGLNSVLISLRDFDVIEIRCCFSDQSLNDDAIHDCIMNIPDIIHCQKYLP
uniref:protein-tyrosine-phosphatase n=1 Tax=Spongospora subterranea TaxID=70186 RepID=A0A0H5QIZ9_9EUKA|eukprot:CRZ01978.1 hypothetical protein [Spongospora subterranea]